MLVIHSPNTSLASGGTPSGNMTSSELTSPSVISAEIDPRSPPAAPSEHPIKSGRMIPIAAAQRLSIDEPLLSNHSLVVGIMILSMSLGKGRIFIM
jgi:hypothetical protein